MQILMLKSQIGLGILSLPAILGTLGLGTGLICIVGIGVIMTCESMRSVQWLIQGADYMIGETKRRYPQVCECTKLGHGPSNKSDSIDDMGYLMGGRIGREIFAIAFWLCKSFAPPPPPP